MIKAQMVSQKKLGVLVLAEKLLVVPIEGSIR